MHFAGFWRRIAAEVIDEIVIVVPIAFYYVLYTFFRSLPAAAVGAFSVKAIGILFLVLFPVIVIWPIFYFVFFDGRTGATWGKRVMNLKVVIREQPNRDGVGYVRAAVRLALAAVIRNLMNVGFLWMLIEPEGRTLHDLTVGTIVVHDPEGRFPVFDPEKLPRTAKHVAWFVVLIILSALPLLGLLVPAQQ